MRDDIEKRACELAVYIIETQSTVRAAAKKCNLALYQQVKAILEVNKAERHIRGGMATRRKYRGSEDS